MKRPSDLAAAILIFTALPAAPAYAYLDAASVSMALQIVIGTAASALLFCKMYLRRITGFFRRRASND
jgi:hypothetical protein